MGKLLMLLSLIALIVIAVGTVVAPQNPAFWLASSTRIFQYVRAILAVLVLMQLLTRPPRNVVFRLFAGTVGLAGIVWTCQQAYAFQMLPFDILSFLGASIAILVTAVERKPEALRRSPKLTKKALA